jgi:hypothetical protein
VSAVGLGLFLSCVLLVGKISLKIDHTEQQTSVRPSRKSIIVYVCAVLTFFLGAAIVVTLEDYKRRCLIPLFIWGWKTQERRSLGRGCIPSAAFAAAFIFRPIHTAAAAVSTSRLHKAIKVEKNQSHMQPK